MKPERAFVAERTAAVHCPELMARARPAAVAEPRDVVAGFVTLADRLARALPAALAALCGAEPEISVGTPQPSDGASLAAALPALAANTLFALGTRGALLMAVEAQAVLGLVDRAFGGSGAVPDPLPAAFPMSANRMIARIEAVLAEALDHALDDAGEVRALRRGPSCARLEPFAAKAPLRLLTLTVSEPTGPTWTIVLAVDEATIAALGQAPAAAAPAAATPTAGPFADIPLGLTAVLVEMRLPMRKLARLAPGDVLPVAVARQVPLKLGTKILATGTVGAADDRVALRLNSNGVNLP